MQFPSSSSSCSTLSHFTPLCQFLLVPCRNPLSSVFRSQSSNLFWVFMGQVPKSEPGSSSPPLYASTSPRNLKDMTISELVTVLRAAYQTEDFDVVEEVLESRYAKLKAEVVPLQEKMESESSGRMHAEQELRKKEEECEKLKKIKESYQILMKSAKDEIIRVEAIKKKNAELECELKEMKKKMEDDIEELRKKNAELERELEEMKKKNVELFVENYKMKEMEKKWVDDMNSIAELRKKNAELEGENCELKEMKKKWVDDRDSIAEMRKKNAELEGENCELKEMKKKWVDDRDSIAEMRKNNAELERENCELEKKWMDDCKALADIRIKVSVLEDEKVNVSKDLVELRRKNGELEEARKKYLATVEEVKAENCKLVDEKRGAEELVETLERQFEELNGRVARLEDDTRILMSSDTGGRNVEGDSPAGLIRAGFGVNDEEDIGDYEFGNDTGGTMKRNEDTHHALGGFTTPLSSKGSKDAPAGRIVKLENGAEIINLVDSDDDDDDGCTSKRWHGKKTLSGVTIKNELQSLPREVQQKNTLAFGLLKRKMFFSDSSSSPSSSEDKFDVDSLPINSVLKKRSKT